MSLVEQERLTLPEHPSSPPVLSGVRVTRSLVYVCFVDRFFVILYFFLWPLCCLFFDLRILITPWYLQTLLVSEWLFNMYVKEQYRINVIDNRINMNLMSTLNTGYIIVIYCHWSKYSFFCYPFHVLPVEKWESNCKSSSLSVERKYI